MVLALQMCLYLLGVRNRHAAYNRKSLEVHGVKTVSSIWPLAHTDPDSFSRDFATLLELRVHPHAGPNTPT
jgi:hypothetical protein